MVTDLKWTTVTNQEVKDSDYRLEASVFNIEAKKAISDIEKCPFPKKDLIGDDGFVKHAHYGGRAKRNYISKHNPDAIGFLGSSEMLQVKPMPEKFLSANGSIDQFRLKKNSILISRSGTIGNLAFVSETLSKYLVSEHAIRFEQVDSPGYLYSFLKTKSGQLLIESKIYGAVVDQIEPEHLASIQVPNPSNQIKKAINDNILKSFELRDQSNNLIDEAESLLVKSLKLPKLTKFKQKYFDSNLPFKNFIVPLSELDDRFDASYHVPIVNSIIDCLLDNALKILPLSNKELTSEINLPGRFKRHYVDESQGTVFLGGKQIYELDPYNKKYLSIKKHGSRIESQLFLTQNTIAITRSGTIGKVNIIPKHWVNWTMSEHVLRVIPKDKSIAGYLFCWLNTDYGYHLIERYTYGAVIDEIEEVDLGKVPVPLLKSKEEIKVINDLVLKANDLRTDAYNLEQEAINLVNKKVIFG